MGQVITFSGANERQVPQGILTYEADYELRYTDGVDIPQTPFTVWNCLAYSAEAFLDNLETCNIIVGTVSHDELQDMRQIIEIAERNRRKTYSKSKMALLQWLKEEGVRVTPDMLQ